MFNTTQTNQKKHPITANLGRQKYLV